MNSGLEIFRVAMSTAGIEHTGQVCADGKLHRFKAEGDHARNSWYVLHAGPPAAGAFGCWKRGIKETWSDRSSNLSQPDWERIRQRWHETEATVKAETVARQKKARRTADWILSRAKPVTTHAYLNAKQVQSHGELREYRGALVLPLRDSNGELHSLQFVGGDGTKTFLTGGRVAGCFFTLADQADSPVVICEGYATGVSIYEATGHSVVCAINCGNLMAVARAVRELWPRREIIVAADNDQFTDNNPGLTKAINAANAIRAKLAVPQFKNTVGRATDFNDLATGEGLDAVSTQIAGPQIPTETDHDAFARLAALPRAEYDRCRETEAATLCIRVKTLDHEVERLRRLAGGNDSTLQGRVIDFPEIELWPHPVDGAEVLNAIADRHQRYVAMSDHEADVCALFEAHCHCFEAFAVTPRLNVTSPEKGCGKTTLRDVIARFVPRPLSTENLSTAVLFRLIEAHKPTLLADEYDSWIKDNEELRGMLNAGHRRGGKALRCEGDKHEVRAFGVFAPAVLCGIGHLPGTLQDRSIVIRLERARPREILERLDSRHTEGEQELCSKLARWCSDNWSELEASDPKMPDSAFNRLADNWRPLFAIAEIAGAGWPERAAIAFDKLTQRQDSEAQGLGVMLLTDIQQVLVGCWPPSPEGQRPLPIERIFSKDLVRLLCDMEERPWAEAQRGKPMNERWLARQLGRFDIHSKTLRIGDQRAKGYESSHFTRAFERYVCEPAEFNRDSVTYEEKTDLASVTATSVVTDGMLPATEGMSRCHAQKPSASNAQSPHEENLPLFRDEEALVL